MSIVTSLIFTLIAFVSSSFGGPKPPPDTPEQRFYRMTREVPEIYRSGDRETARTRAEILLTEAEKWKTDWNYGNAVHVGNIVLGLIELDKGNKANAVERLKAAGRTPGSSQLRSFGPNMRLAEKLLDKGETEAVLEYLELCRKFWTFGSARRLDHWVEEVKAGRKPDFGPNYDYQF